MMVFFHLSSAVNLFRAGIFKKNIPVLGNLCLVILIFLLFDFFFFKDFVDLLKSSSSCWGMGFWFFLFLLVLFVWGLGEGGLVFVCFFVSLFFPFPFLVISFCDGLGASTPRIVSCYDLMFSLSQITAVGDPTGCNSYMRT